MVVYLIIMLADWMQGTHMYTLYLSYGVNVAALFLTGFLSGAIFAPFLGVVQDTQIFAHKFQTRSTNNVIRCIR